MVDVDVKQGCVKDLESLHESRFINRESKSYIFDAKSVIRSLQRLEYPHSLSYHARTLAQFDPTTRV
jgi:hypothetical protein